jgi:hypothetical protein
MNFPRKAQHQHVRDTAPPTHTPNVEAPTTSPTAATESQVDLSPQALSGKSPAKMLALQRTMGNQALMRMLNATTGTPSMINRAIRDVKTWKKDSAIGDNGKKIRTPRSGLLRKIDKALKVYLEQRGFPQFEFGRTAIDTLQSAINDWKSDKGGDSQRLGKVTALENEVASELPEVDEMVAIRNTIRDTYGIALDNEAGIHALTQSYKDEAKSKSIFKKLQQKPWNVKELRMIQQAVAVYGPILGANRDVALGDQSITSISRLKGSASTDDQGNAYIEGEKGTGLSTMGETFTSEVDGEKLKNFSMFEPSLEVLDFAGDPHNPTQEELDKGYRGTAIHELSHGLIEKLPAPNGAADYPDGKKVTNMINHWANTLAYWTKVYTASGAPGAEAPITDYGQKSAAEDLGEAIMFFVEDPVSLESKCPIRYNFIANTLSAYLSAQTISDADAKVRAANPQRFPPPLPPAPLGAGTGAAAGAGAGAVTSQMLQDAKTNLKPLPEEDTMQDALDEVSTTTSLEDLLSELEGLFDDFEDETGEEEFTDALDEPAPEPVPSSETDEMD